MTDFFSTCTQPDTVTGTISLKNPFLYMTKTQWVAWITTCAKKHDPDTTLRQTASSLVFHLLPHAIKKQFTDSTNDPNPVLRLMGHEKMSINGMQLIIYMQQLGLYGSTMERILNLILRLHLQEDTGHQQRDLFTWTYTLTHRQKMLECPSISSQTIEAIYDSHDEVQRKKAFFNYDHHTNPCLDRLPIDEENDLKKIAWITPPAAHIEKSLVALQHDIKSHLEHHNNPWAMAAMVYHRIMRIQPFNRNNEAAALHIMNQCLQSTGIKPLQLFPKDTDRYHHALSLQADHHRSVTQLIMEYYLQQYPTCPHSQTLWETYPKNIQNLLWKNAKLKDFTSILALLEIISEPYRIDYIDQKNHNDWTLLHYACKANCQLMINRLLTWNASPSIKNNWGQKAFDLLPDKALQKTLIEQWQEYHWHECDNDASPPSSPSL